MSIVIETFGGYATAGNSLQQCGFRSLIRELTENAIVSISGVPSIPDGQYAAVYEGRGAHRDVYRVNDIWILKLQKLGPNHTSNQLEADALTALAGNPFVTRLFYTGRCKVKSGLYRGALLPYESSYSAVLTEYGGITADKLFGQVVKEPLDSVTLDFFMSYYTELGMMLIQGRMTHVCYSDLHTGNISMQSVPLHHRIGERVQPIVIDAEGCGIGVFDRKTFNDVGSVMLADFAFQCSHSPYRSWQLLSQSLSRHACPFFKANGWQEESWLRAEFPNLMLRIHSEVSGGLEDIGPGERYANEQTVRELVTAAYAGLQPPSSLRETEAIPLPYWSSPLQPPPPPPPPAESVKRYAASASTEPPMSVWSVVENMVATAHVVAAGEQCPHSHEAIPLPDRSSPLQPPPPPAPASGSEELYASRASAEPPMSVWSAAGNMSTAAHADAAGVQRCSANESAALVLSDSPGIPERTDFVSCMPVISSGYHQKSGKSKIPKVIPEDASVEDAAPVGSCAVTDVNPACSEAVGAVANPVQVVNTATSAAEEPSWHGDDWSWWSFGSDSWWSEDFEKGYADRLARIGKAEMERQLVGQFRGQGRYAEDRPGRISWSDRVTLNHFDHVPVMSQPQSDDVGRFLLLTFTALHNVLSRCRPSSRGKKQRRAEEEKEFKKYGMHKRVFRNISKCSQTDDNWFSPEAAYWVLDEEFKLLEGNGHWRFRIHGFQFHDEYERDFIIRMIVRAYIANGNLYSKKMPL